ncbi:hypothetical protein L1887_18677 [Cichorium endivia]|nr:hypothetical protein L1887_18677 [Cichorium endivia]
MEERTANCGNVGQRPEVVGDVYLKMVMVVISGGRGDNQWWLVEASRVVVGLRDRLVITSISIDVNLLLIGSHKKQKGKGDMMTAILIGWSKEYAYNMMTAVLIGWSKEYAYLITHQKFWALLKTFRPKHETLMDRNSKSPYNLLLKRHYYPHTLTLFNAASLQSLALHASLRLLQLFSDCKRYFPRLISPGF